MTALVALRCQDGVVIAADSCFILGPEDGDAAIEQTSGRKIAVVWGGTEKLIVAGAGSLGHHQRFVDSIRRASVAGRFRGKCELDVARELGRVAREEFGDVQFGGVRQMPYTAFVAFEADGAACLCELSGTMGMSPEIKPVDGQWFASAGSARVVTDTLLSFFRSNLWPEAPNVRAGMATAWWVLNHACAISSGGVRPPIRVAVFGARNGKLDAWIEDDLDEIVAAAQGAADHLGTYRDVLLGIRERASV